MNSLVSLYRFTKELLELLEQPVPVENRDGLIDQISLLLESRDTTILDIKPPYTEEEKRLGKELVRMNVLIDSKLEGIKNNIQFDITQIKNSKKNTNKYVTPYQKSISDGIFFDKKK